MFQKSKEILTAIHHDQKGSYFVEMALVLIGVGLTVFVAASGLANNGIVPKYTDIKTYISGINTP
ncbi:MAG: hypothetical protein VR68_03910 [Peptococcaceae bacterium BRH_c4a]|nr:MAG: hypothetical protein VR68_03910 [Peptococcaceae bacterium BRH_c4a]